MAYMVCESHGGNGGAIVSEKVLSAIVKSNCSVKLFIIHHTDGQGKFFYVVDEAFYSSIKDKYDLDLSEPITSEDIALEIYFELTIVCSGCLKDFIFSVINQSDNIEYKESLLDIANRIGDTI